MAIVSRNVRFGSFASFRRANFHLESHVIHGVAEPAGDRADGIDLGLWTGIAPSQLIIPVDTHIQRISRYLGLTLRKNADWRMACEITSALRHYDRNDPVKYDFSLAHLGISEKCNGTDAALCLTCGIAEICPQNPAARP
jgi:hypothetical protein